ncbi:hypothetical protein M378DRAFT_182068 [Amanita muscaria Koide BX008]|uniref:Uncharacterized protein n=1 Tax=Amanita muscaria (strain Koide BX008) TaxID=946122 RepID=A0A0C2W4L1_AMAMK|nr:hypothetical protein M378DRAFT_182068 [Amanita muscaria Koide BX008]
MDIPEEQQTPGNNVQRDRQVDRTDEMIRDIVQDATRACLRRGVNTIALLKLGVKLPLPEYKGSDTLEAFIRFTKEVTKYLNLNNLLVPEYESYHTDLLGQMLHDKAKNWYIHTVGANSDQLISLTEALIALKRYFVKDASSRDSASKFDRISQGGRTVPELFRELERLSHQMIQPPSEYDFKCRFVKKKILRCH